jgi:hypothetical protein
MSQMGSFIQSSGVVTILTLTGNVGGAVGPTLGGNINLIGGAGITVTGNPGTNTLTITGAATPFTWNVATVDGNMAVDNGYISNKAGLLTMTLPAVAAVGDIVRITGKNAGNGWKIAQNGGQTIFIESLATTTGGGGSLASGLTRDAVELVCVTANTDWNVISSMGNLVVT